MLTIESSTVIWSLSEAQTAIEGTRSELANDSTAIIALYIYLADILGELCVAWHRRWSDSDSVLNEDFDKYYERSISAPNVNGMFKLVSFAQYIVSTDSPDFKDEADGSTVDYFLDLANAAIESCIGILKTEQGSEVKVSALENCLQQTISILCCAWHFRHLSLESVGQLNASVKDAASVSLPAWDVNARLIPSSEMV